MIRVVSGAKVMALAFSHPSYTVEHIQDTITIEDGKVTMGKQPVTRESRKTVATLYDVTTDGFKERACAEVKVHWQDNFNRSEGRKLALKRLLNPQKATFSADERKAIWEAYWNRATAEHISPPKPRTGTVTPFAGAGAPTPLQMLGNTHQVSNYIV